MNVSKKLILFSYDFPPSTGGIARLCQEIVVGLQHYYADITVLTRKKNGLNIPHNRNKVKVIELPSRRISCEIAAIKFLSNLKNKHEYQIVCGVWHPEVILAMLAGFKKIFVLGHGMEFLSGKSLFRKYFWHKVYVSYILRRCELLICNSHYTEGLVKQINPSIPTTVLTLAVNTAFFKPHPREVESTKFNICTVSRIEKFKGHDFIANVISKLPDYIKERIQWNIAGVGPDLAFVKEFVNKLGIGKNVSFMGFVPDDLLPKFYSDNDLFILRSRENDESSTVEGFGLVFLEAQSCGTPVIGTKTGGIADAIVTDEGGWLIEQNNEEELEILLTKLYSDNTYLKTMGIKGLKRVNNEATWEIYCKKLFAIINV